MVTVLPQAADNFRIHRAHRPVDSVTVQIMSSPKRQFTQLGQPGPHSVARGNLALVGIPGYVFTPVEGTGLPAVAFGHGLLQPPARYAGLLRHLASWGIVAACPATQRSPLPSHRMYAADLRVTLDICTDVRLGEGEISVDPKKLGLAGHSMGAAAAVLLAAEDPRVRAVATLAIAESLPSAADFAARCTMPSLHIAAGEDLIAPTTAHATPIAKAWAGPAQLRTAPKASHLAFTEGRHWTELLLHGKANHKSMRTAKALLTAFFLKHLTGASGYDALLDAELKGADLA